MTKWKNQFWTKSSEIFRPKTRLQSQSTPLLVLSTLWTWSSMTFWDGNNFSFCRIGNYFQIISTRGQFQTNFAYNKFFRCAKLKFESNAKESRYRLSQDFSKCNFIQNRLSSAGCFRVPRWYELPVRFSSKTCSKRQKLIKKEKKGASSLSWVGWITKKFET